MNALDPLWWSPALRGEYQQGEGLGAPWCVARFAAAVLVVVGVVVGHGEDRAWSVHGSIAAGQGRGRPGPAGQLWTTTGGYAGAGPGPVRCGVLSDVHPPGLDTLTGRGVGVNRVACGAGATTKHLDGAALISFQDPLLRCRFTPV